MALQLFKLVVTSSIAENRYFNKATAAFTVTTALTTFRRSTFWNDTGALLGATTMVPATSNGYYMLNIAGVLQQASLYQVNTTGVVLHLTAGNTLTYSIARSAPITLAVTNPAITS